MRGLEGIQNNARLGLVILSGLVAPSNSPQAKTDLNTLDIPEVPGISRNFLALMPGMTLANMGMTPSETTWGGKPISNEDLFTPTVTKDGTVVLPIADEKDPAKFSPIWTMQGDCWVKGPDKTIGMPFSGVNGLTAPVLASSGDGSGSASTKYFVITPEMKKLKFGLAGNKDITYAYASLTVDGKEMNRVGPESPKNVVPVSWDLTKYEGKTAQVTLKQDAGWLAMVKAAETPITHRAGFHIAPKFNERVRATLSTTVSSPDTSDGTLKWIAPVPPQDETQKLVSSTIRCREYPDLPVKIVSDKNDPTRKYMTLELPITQGTLTSVTFDVIYTLDLYKIDLIPGSPSSSNASEIPQKELDNCLRASRMLDFKSDAFQNYLRANSLIKSDSESNFEFAYRAYKIIANELVRRTIPNSPGIPINEVTLSKICQPNCTVGSCGESSLIFTGTMRANGIPSRLMVGRWALNQAGGYGQDHVKSSFLCTDNGFLQVDQTFGQNELRAGRNPDPFFGTHPGIFITMHANTDLSPTGAISFGRQVEVPLSQFAINCYDGTSAFRPRFTDNWAVEVLKK